MRFRRGLALSIAAACLAAAGCDKGATDPDDTIIPTLPPVAPGTVLLFDDFDNENGGVGVNNWTGFVNWNVVDGCVDLHGNGFWDVQRGHGLYVDLDGSCWAAGTIESKAEFSLSPGTYVLEFWLAGNQRSESPDTVQVTLGTVFDEQFVLQQSDQFRSITRRLDLATATTARLRFRNSGADQQGALLDQVRLRRAQ